MYSNKQLQKKYIQDYHWDVIHGSLAVGTRGDEMVKFVGAKIRPVYEAILLEAGKEEEVSKHQWEFNVLVRDFPDAYAIPGGKVMFYSALIPVCKNEDGIAFVMSHELGHVLANHYCEGETNQQLGEVAAFALLTVATQGDLDYYTTDFISASMVYTVRAAFNHKKEMEADRIGVILMAKAGYDPASAVEYLDRYDSLMNYMYLIEPNHKDSIRRAELINTYIPEAQKYYNEYVQ
jgi:predicted Zn-dependent protease